MENLKSGPPSPTLTPLAVAEENRPDIRLLELTDFLVSLIPGCQPSNSRQENKLSLHGKILKIKNYPELIEVHGFDEISVWRKRIEYKILEENLSQDEQQLCFKLINNYLATPGYKHYQAYCRSLWQNNQNQPLHWKKIQTVICKAENEINQLKETYELGYRSFKKTLAEARKTALELHHLLIDCYPENPPSIDQQTLKVECSLEQLEFATKEMAAKFGFLMQKARLPKEIAHLTRLLQIILCGEKTIKLPLQMNPVCIILRETLNQNHNPVLTQLFRESLPLCALSNRFLNEKRKEEIAEDPQLMSETQACLNGFLKFHLSETLHAFMRTCSPPSLSQSCLSFSANSDLFFKEIQHPFDRESIDYPVASVETCFKIPCIENEAQEPLMIPMRSLCINWAAPLYIRKKLVCLVLDPTSEPHLFTHPLTGRNLNRFANEAVVKFSVFAHPLDVPEEEAFRLNDFSVDEKEKYRSDFNQLSNVKAKIKKDVCSVYDYEEREVVEEFFDRFIAIFTSSTSVEEFKRKLIELTAKKEFKDEFLSKLLLALDKNGDSLQKLAKLHKHFKLGYERAIQLAHRKHTYLCSVFCGESDPVVHPTTGSITVAFARFRLAKCLFDHAFSWMIDFADTKEKEAFTSHVLAYILCGKDSPSCEKLFHNIRCFVIQEFANEKGCTQVVLVPSGRSYNQQMVCELSGHADYSADQFIPSVEKAVSLHIGDAFTRNQYQINFGNLCYTTLFKCENDLLKPFFIERILNSYAAFLKSHPNQMAKIRKTPIAVLVKKYLTLDFFRQSVLQNAQDESNHFMIAATDKLIKYLHAVPEEYQDLIFLKLIEVMGFVNQNLSLKFGNFIGRLKFNFPKPEDSFDITPCHDSPFWFSIVPPACETFICTTSVKLLLHKKTVITPKGKFTPAPICPAQMNFLMRIPSQSETDRLDMEICPTITFSGVAVSALAPLSFIDGLASAFDSQLVEVEQTNCSLLGIQAEISKLCQSLMNLEKMLKSTQDLDLNILESLESHFLDVYKLIKKMDLLLTMFDVSDPDEDEKFRLMKKEKTQFMSAFKKIFLRILKQYEKAGLAQNPEVNDVLEQVFRNFSDFRKK